MHTQHAGTQNRQILSVHAYTRDSIRKDTCMYIYLMKNQVIRNAYVIEIL